MKKKTLRLIVRLADISENMKVIHKLTGKSQLIVLAKEYDFETLSELEEIIRGSRFLTNSWSVKRSYCTIKIYRKN